MNHPIGRHELGQNFLTDPRVVETIVGVVATWPDDRPLLELGPGDGALTDALATLGRPLTAVELDARRADALQRRLAGRVDVLHGDLLAHDLGSGADIVSNVPYGITTPLLRRTLAAPRWRHALLLVQWEVARKRAGVGGTTMLTAQWWPWFTFGLIDRVPARAFRPVPSVDGGLLLLERRPQPLVTERGAYQSLVGAIFAGRGRGVVDVVSRRHGRELARRWASVARVDARALPGRLDAEQWVALHAMVQGRGVRSAATRPSRRPR